jgi:hypothetical protein
MSKLPIKPSPKKSLRIKEPIVLSTNITTIKTKNKNAFRPDVKQTAALVKVGRVSSANAIRASKALGLSITYLQNGVLYKEDSNGTKEILSTTNNQNSVSKKTPLQLKKGMLLHAKK